MFLFRPEMGSRKYLVLFHVVSAGENGEGLGSDEADIVLVLYLVLDIVQNKVGSRVQNR